MCRQNESVAVWHAAGIVIVCETVPRGARQPPSQANERPECGTSVPAAWRLSAITRPATDQPLEPASKLGLRSSCSLVQAAVLLVGVVVVGVVVVGVVVVG